MSDPLVPERATSGRLATHATRAVSALIFTSFMLAGMWVLEIADFMLDGRLDQYGIRAHDVGDLPQIFSAPFLHGGFGHLIANSLPFLVLGTLAAARGLTRFLAMNLVVILVGGAGVWLFGSPGAETLGASILIFGYFGYLLGRGVFERHLADIAIAVTVVLLYGTMILGVLPTDPRISWQGHLFGLIGGVLAAWTLRRRKVAAARPVRPAGGDYTGGGLSPL
jgi:membrane associated rhomboid family serine protease